VTRRIGAAATAAAVALVAGTAVALALHAAARYWGDEAAALLIALVAAWLTQAIPPLIRRRTQ